MDSIKTFPKFTMFFAFLIGVELLGLTVIPEFHKVSKALIMASLIGFYISEERRQSNAFLLGLIAALLGDCFLLFNSSQFFTIGLFSFLIMQICYILTFNKKRRIANPIDYFIPLGIGIVGLLILSFIWDDLGDMKTPVALYTASILLMAIYAFLRHPRLRGYKILLIGVGLFILSDAVLAINKFGADEIPYGRILVMMTYMIAQYCIVTGEVLSGVPRPKKEKKKGNTVFARHRV